MNNLTIPQIVSSYDLFEYVGSVVELKRNGNEAVGLCPIHGDTNPSFTVYAKNGKQSCKCFSCGFSGDIIDFVKAYDQCSTKVAIDTITGRKQHVLNRPARKPVVIESFDPYADFKVLPLPDFNIEVGVNINVFNPKKNKVWAMTPTAVHKYDDGYVLRVEFKNGKVTPVVRYCLQVSTGLVGFCCYPFPDSDRKIYGNLRETGPVYIVEGEKATDYMAGLTVDKNVSVISWSGGTNAVDKTDWSPLVGRDVVALPDNDLTGFKAMLSVVDKIGCQHVIDPSGLARGFDVADGNFTQAELFDFMASRLISRDEFEVKVNAAIEADKLKKDEK